MKDMISWVDIVSWGSMLLSTIVFFFTVLKFRRDKREIDILREKLKSGKFNVVFKDIEIPSPEVRVIGLASSILSFILGYMNLKAGKEEKTIAGYYITSKSKEGYRAITWLLICFILSIANVVIFNTSFTFSIVVITLIALVSVQQFVLRYRVAKGYFGSNNTEARELLKFILDMDEHGKNQGGKPIFPDVKEELKKELAYIREGRTV